MFFNRDAFLKLHNKLFHFILFQVVRIISTSFLIIMSSPGQKRGSSQLMATQPPLGVPGTSAVRDVSGSATRHVQGPGTSDVATQPLQAPGAELATQPLQAPGAGTASTGSWCRS